ncbi:MAG TPA: HAMP domain-containing sensor histidine kinase [Kofleriaceae bacterium]|nr:HAMP domain-containing sensor histidine kinase [Kofleriaceae bacterium]
MRDLAMRLHRAEQLSALAVLTSGLAHELRNPANGIINALEPLRELLPPELLVPNGGVAELLEAMKASADQMWFLVNQLLGFRSNTELELRSVEIGELVRRSIRLASGALEQVTVNVELSAARTVLCAPPLMIQVLTNLVENAGDAAGRGGWVEVRTVAHTDTLRIEVTDSGPGVPVGLRERIFEPFFTTKDPKPGTGGTGLGLAVARAIVHRHRGTLEVRVRGDRTAFVIELPTRSNLERTAGTVSSAD